MRDKILEKINSKEWKFHQLLKLSEAANVVAEEMYQEMTPHEQLTLVWNEDFSTQSKTFGTFFKEIVMATLHKEIMKAFQEKFEDATVNFDAPAQKSHAPPPPPPPMNEKSADTRTLEALSEGKDVNLVEKDGKVSTRAGKVNVKRV
tara:strand:- start:1177 stop:1617 length:441 start_codon:yes stop_codon:yes gene_type:complete